MLLQIFKGFKGNISDYSSLCFRFLCLLCFALQSKFLSQLMHLFQNSHCHSFLAFILYSIFHSKIIISSVFAFTSSRQTFSELKFSFLPVIMLSVSILNFFIFKFLQLLISTSIFTSDLTSNLIRTSILNFNFTHHL